MRTPTYICLDVDQVINDWRVTPQVPDGHKRFVADNGYTITFNPEIIARLQSLVHPPFQEILWLTTWQGQANTLLREKLGFKTDFKTLYDLTFHQSGWWKATHVRFLLEQGCRVVWLDDDIKDEYNINPESRSWIDYHSSRGMLHWTSPAVSLTPHDLDKVEEFIDE